MSSFTVISYSPKLEMVSLYNDKFQLTKDFSISLIEENTEKIYRITISKGAIWDGLSIPKPFRWFMPEIDYTNELYSAAGLVHDCLYASELLSKSISDDIFRSILRDAGMTRFKASTAHLCVKMFANCHYGIKHDTNNLRNFIKVSIQ